MNTNKIAVISSIIVILLIIFIPTIYKVVGNYQNNLLRSTESKIIEAAKSCYFEENCVNDKIFLNELYNLNYLEEKISNPITKEYYSDNSYILIKDGEFIFNEEWLIFTLFVNPEHTT